MKKEIKDPRLGFDELECLVEEFQGEKTPVEEKTSSTTAIEDQFEKELGRLSVRQVEIKRGNDSSDYSYFM